MFWYWLSIHFSIAAIILFLMTQFTYLYLKVVSCFLLPFLFKALLWSQRYKIFVTQGCFFFLLCPGTSLAVDGSFSVIFLARASTSPSDKLCAVNLPPIMALKTAMLQSCTFSKSKRIRGCLSGAREVDNEREHSFFMLTCLRKVLMQLRSFETLCYVTVVLSTTAKQSHFWQRLSLE